MIFLGNLVPITDTKYQVFYVHYEPLDPTYGLGKSVDQLRLEGILVDTLPDPQPTANQTYLTYVNPQTNEVWYEYSDMPKTEVQTLIDKINSQQDTILAMQDAINTALGL